MPVSSYRLFVLLCSAFVIITSEASAQPISRYYFCVDDNGNYTANGPYETNLNTLLFNLASNTEINYGFYNNFSYGENIDRVYAIGLCRGDVKPEDCRSCLNDSRVLLTQNCPNQKEAIGWYDHCMLRYSNRFIFGITETLPAFYLWSQNNATDWDQFNQVLGNLMTSLRSTAASGDSRRKYDAVNATAPNFQYVYGLVQCTPDLSQQDCSDCLAGAISKIPACCSSKRGGRVVTPSCNVRYENYRFFDTAEPLPPLSNNTTSTQGAGPNKRSLSSLLFISLEGKGKKRIESR